MHLKPAIFFAVSLLTFISGCSKSQSVEELSSTSPASITVEPGTIHVHLTYKGKKEGELILQIEGAECDRLRVVPSEDQGTPVTLTANGLSSGQHRLQVLLQLGDAEPIVRTTGVALVP